MSGGKSNPRSIGSTASIEAAGEAARIALQIGSGTAEAILFVADLGEELPIINPVLKTLKTIRERLETVKGNREGLSALHERCAYITACVIDRCRRDPTSEIDVTPLVTCVEAIQHLVERCGRQRRVWRVIKASTNRDGIARLNARLDQLNGDLGLAGITVLEAMGRRQAERQEEILAKQSTLIDHIRQPAVEIAKIPKGTPAWKSWNVERLQVMQYVLAALTDTGSPRMVSIVGDSGAGKTTIASATVRSAKVREVFSGGVVWLSVDIGATGRLPSLMMQLARKVHEEIAGSVGLPPAAQDDVMVYIKQRIENAQGRKGLKCLLVADNVWEEEVVSKLLETGMWILVSTRNQALVKNEYGEAVRVDELSEADAESVLRRAAELPLGVRLPDDAVEMIELCSRVAMDLAFMGRWSTVRGRHDRSAWADAVEKVREEIEKARVEVGGDDAWEMRTLRRKAILRAGFGDLATGSDDGRVPRLYLSLAVMPDGHAFTTADAAVLLFDRTPSDEDIVSVRPVVEALERWTILHAIDGMYRMHDAHSSFARENLMDDGKVLRSACSRWVRTISSLEAIRSTDPFHLKGRWLAVEAVGGDGWDKSRPYAAELASMDDSDPLLRKSLEALARFHGAQEDWKGAGTWWRRLLEVERRDVGGNHPCVLNTLHSLADCASRLGDVKEAEEWYEEERQALPLVLAKMKLREDNKGGQGVGDADGLAYLATTMLTWAPDRQAEAEQLLKSSLEIQECKLGREDLGVAHTLQKLAVCVGQAGKHREAESFLRRCLSIREAKLGCEDLGVAYTVYLLGVNARNAGRFDEAEGLFRRCLRIRETKLGPHDIQVSYTLYNLGECLLRKHQGGEAEELLRRCLKIQETALGQGHEQVATTLDLLGTCVREQGRKGEAGELSRRSMAIVRTA